MIFAFCLLPFDLLSGQQPQAQSGQPIYAVNAKWVNGVAPGYWPTTGSGLTLNLSAGSAVCDRSAVTYAGGTITMAASSTNYVYLDLTNSCAPASNTSGFTDAAIPIAKVVTGASTITTITDYRISGFSGARISDSTAFADRFAGADACAKITNALAALPSTGGIVDARGLTGAQTCSGGFTMLANTTLQLGETVLTITAPIVLAKDSAILGRVRGDIHSTTETNPSVFQGGTRIIAGSGFTGTPSAMLQFIGPSSTAISEANVRLADLEIDGIDVASYGVYLDLFAYAFLERVAVRYCATDSFRFGVTTTTGSFIVHAEDLYAASDLTTTTAYHIEASQVRCTRCVSDAHKYSVHIETSPGQQAEIIGGNFSGATTTSILIDNASGGFNKIVDSEMSPSGATGIAINDSNQNIVLGNWITGPNTTGSVGISFATPGNLNTVGSNLIQNFEKAISDAAPGNNMFYGNATYSALGTAQGIVVPASNDVIFGNRISVPSGNNAINITGSGNQTYGNNFANGIKVAGTLPNLLSGGGAFGLNSVTFSATPTFDASLGNTQTITLTGNVTSSTLSNCSAGEWLVFDITEDATGGRTFVAPTTLKGFGTINTTASKHNVQMFYCDGTNAWAASPMQSN